jgi:hypothetical protein
MEILKHPMKIVWAGRAVTVIAALPFVPSATMKLMGHPAIYFQIALGLFIWLGPYLREPRLRELLPLRISQK